MKKDLVEYYENMNLVTKLMMRIKIKNRNKKTINTLFTSNISFFYTAYAQDRAAGL